jgi:dTMP kinase
MKFAVIEGLDGSGKSPQINKLLEFLKQNKISFEYLHFPRTDSPVYGDLIARFLRGEFGDNDKVNPYLVALIYAGDRSDAAPMIRQWLDEKKLVLVDRYVLSNIAYQCAKLAISEEARTLEDWIINLEYNYNRIPKPDVNIFLDVPFNFTIDRLSRSRHGKDRTYLQGTTDIHEADIDFQRKVRNVYVKLSKTEPTLKLISCSEGEKMMSPEKIFGLLINSLKAEGVL